MGAASAAAKAAAAAGEEKKGDMGISKLGLRLRDARFRPAGEAVVRGYDAFQGYLTALFNRKTEAQDIGYVVSNIQIDKDNRLDATRIKSQYQIFDTAYKNLIKKCLGSLFLALLVQKYKYSRRRRWQMKVSATPTSSP